MTEEYDPTRPFGDPSRPWSEEEVDKDKVADAIMAEADAATEAMEEGERANFVAENQDYNGTKTIYAQTHVRD